MVSSSQRSRDNVAKGEGFQKHIASQIASVLRLPLSDVWSARSGVGGECDAQLSTRAHRLFPFWVEAKDRGKIAMGAWLRQAMRDATSYSKQLRIPGFVNDPAPVVVFRAEGRAWAVVPLESFLHLAANDRFRQEEKSR